MNGLETLDLSSNELSGEIPVGLKKLKALKHLNISFNNLEGKIPSFPNSKEVELQGNPKLFLDLEYRNTPNGSRKWIIVMLKEIVRHRNIVKLITACSSLDFRNNEFLVLDRLDAMIDVASALVYLHHEGEIPVVHCDIKPWNVLFDSDMTAKVGDFGISRLLIERIGNEASISSTHALKGSIGYIPPEYGLGQKPSTAGDVYSYGIMLLEVFTGRSPTNESFEGLSGLKNLVQMAFPANIERVLDHALLLPVPENDVGDDNRLYNINMMNVCLTSIIGIGLTCVADSPDERISIKGALNSLKNIKSTLLKPISSQVF
ncbi:hypothetical protein LIER_25329 [Lithospermum erythrorhizon]|uniref:non-specific serine/threonine protein kinase n=1 Tax=Lithospermum erythrorhizon TaxID=34254 RepID=A0AAV3R493_LITER